MDNNNHFQKIFEFFNSTQQSQEMIQQTEMSFIFGQDKNEKEFQNHDFSKKNFQINDNFQKKNVGNNALKLQAQSGRIQNINLRRVNSHQHPQNDSEKSNNKLLKFQGEINYKRQKYDNLKNSSSFYNYLKNKEESFQFIDKVFNEINSQQKESLSFIKTETELDSFEDNNFANPFNVQEDNIKDFQHFANNQSYNDCNGPITQFIHQNQIQYSAESELSIIINQNTAKDNINEIIVTQQSQKPLNKQHSTVVIDEIEDNLSPLKEPEQKVKDGVLPLLQAMVLYKDASGTFDKVSEHRLKTFAQYLRVKGFNVFDGKILQCKTCHKKFDDTNHALRHLSGHWYVKDGKLRNVFFDEEGSKFRKCHACNQDVEIANYAKHFQNNCIKKDLLFTIMETFDYVKYRHPYILLISWRNPTKDFHNSINNPSWSLAKAIINKITYKIYRENPDKNSRTDKNLQKVPEVYLIPDMAQNHIQRKTIQSQGPSQLILAQIQVEIYKDYNKKCQERVRIESNKRKDLEFQVMKLKLKMKKIQKSGNQSYSSDSDDLLSD